MKDRNLAEMKRKQDKTRSNFPSMHLSSPQRVVKGGGHDLTVVLVEGEGSDALRVCPLHLTQTLSGVHPPHLFDGTMCYT